MQRPCPIWLATNAERLSKGQADSGGSELALTRVGKIADGWMTHSVSPEGFQRSWDFILRVGREAGRDVSRFDNVLYHHINVNEDKEAALADSKKFLDLYYSADYSRERLESLADLRLAARLRCPSAKVQGVRLPAHHLPDLDHGRSDAPASAPGRGRAAPAELRAPS